MELSPEAEARYRELRLAAPICRRGVWRRFGNRVYLCGTIGSEFDVWQRRLSVLSAADALFSQQIGLEEVESVMDELEHEASSELSLGERLSPRRSPGYAELPLALSVEIVEMLDATRKIGVSVTESLLLVPSKSVTAVCDVVSDDEHDSSKR